MGVQVGWSTSKMVPLQKSGRSISRMAIKTIVALLFISLVMPSSDALFLSTPASTCNHDFQCKYPKCVQHEDYALCKLGNFLRLYNRVCSYKECAECIKDHHCLDSQKCSKFYCEEIIEPSCASENINEVRQCLKKRNERIINRKVQREVQRQNEKNSKLEDTGAPNEQEFSKEDEGGFNISELEDTAPNEQELSKEDEGAFNIPFGNMEEHFNHETIGEYLKLETEKFLEETGATM